MQWRGRRQSTNVEDRRTIGTGKMAAGGGIGAIIITVIGLLIASNGDIGSLFNSAGSLIPGATTNVSLTDAQVQMGEFVSVVQADTEDFWTQQFEASGLTYEAPKLVLFTDYVSTGSGGATSAVGPFYSPADKTVYIDLTFFEDMASKYGAGGDFAQAYVIAHEVGHHVQNLLGVLSQVSARAASKRGGEESAVRSARTAGRLLRGGVGVLREPTGVAGDGRYR
jgi:predicted metalloprotease